MASNLNILPHIANFTKIASLQEATFGIQFKSPEAGDFSPVSSFSPLHAFLDLQFEYLLHIASPLEIFAKIANFAEIAIFAKIASLQGATFGIQFKSPEADDFSPLHAWGFLPKSPISPKSPFSPKSPASKGPLLASNSNHQRLMIFRHFRHCMHGDS